MSNTINTKTRPAVINERTAREWLESLTEGDGQIPNPDDVQEPGGGCFAHEVDQAVKAIRAAAPDDEGTVEGAVEAIIEAGRMNAGMEAVWQVVRDPHQLVDYVESHRDVDMTRPLLRTYAELEAWFRAVVASGPFWQLPRKSFLEIGETEERFSDEQIAGLDDALARTREHFADPDAAYERIVREYVGTVHAA